MKAILKWALAFACFSACTSRQDESSPGALEKRLAALEQNVSALKPGLGEIMSTIHLHHAKLYCSGEKENWELASYQLDEIGEGLDQAAELHDHIPETAASLKDLRHLTDKGLSEVQAAIRAKSKTRFIAGFKTLTHSCNACHESTGHAFIAVQLPTAAMFSNQRFNKEN